MRDSEQETSTTVVDFLPELEPDPKTSARIVRSKAPVRISFAGGGTDFPHWFERRAGAVLCATICNYARVTVYPRPDKAVRIRSVDLGYMANYSLEEEPVYDGMLDLAKAAIRRLGCSMGFDLDVRCDAPPGSGLGGSSALVSAIIGALAAYQNLVLDPYELAELNYAIERRDLGIAGGMQDQYATTFGGFNLIEFSKSGVLVNPLRLDEGLLADLEAHLMLCYVGNVHAHTGLIDRQIRYYHEKRAATLEGMDRIHSLVYDMKRALLKGNLAGFGELLHEGFVNKKRMNPGITEGTIADPLYEEARKHGAIGGKLMGAGGGGYLLLYCETHRQHEVRKALERRGGVVANCALEPRGLQVWRTRSL
ncbi:MAG: GHMP kinase [Bryobacteraceae bacterium]|jgi:D-glycero-alpha-D-manno-heptose-7-phosphate kinase